MESNSSANPYRELPIILFTFVQMLSIGAFISLFLAAYLTFDESLFNQRIQIYQGWITYFWLAGLVATGVIIFLLRNKEDVKPGNVFFQDQGNISYSIFIVLLTIVFLTKYFNIPINIFNFLTFLAAIYTLFNIAQQYTFSDNRPAWQHPTTAGNIIQGTFILGGAVGLWSYAASPLQNTYAWIVTVILIFEGLTLWSRFRFLSRTSQVTRQAALMMLGSHLTLFGVRFIFGIVMPFIYLLWVLIIKDLPLHPVILMLFVGELSERILFFITAEQTLPAPVESAQDSAQPDDKTQEEENAD